MQLHPAANLWKFLRPKLTVHPVLCFKKLPVNNVEIQETCLKKVHKTQLTPDKAMRSERPYGCISVGSASKDAFSYDTNTFSRLCTGALHTGQLLNSSAHDEQQQKCRHGRRTVLRATSMPRDGWKGCAPATHQLTGI